MRRDSFNPVAGSVPFDNSSNGFTSEDTQAAIEEVKASVAASASPGFTWGRSGTVTKNTWLLNDSVPSNTSGRIIALNGAVIKEIFCANEDPTAGIVLGIYQHEGGLVNAILLGAVTTLAQRSNTFSVSFSVTFGKQLAVKLESSSVNAKNIVVGVQIAGSV